MLIISKFSKSLLLLLAILHALPSAALPKYVRTTLPFPNRMDDRDKKLVQEALKLEVYQDSDDPNQYYYIPPFRIRQYTRGAAGMFLNVVPVKAYAAANKKLDERTDFATEYTNKKLEDLTNEKKEQEKKVGDAQDKLQEALVLGNQQLVAIRTQTLDRKMEELKEASERLKEAETVVRDGGSLLPRGLGRSYFEHVLTNLSRAGFHLPFAGGEPGDELLQSIRSTLDQLALSYGGFLSVNAYAGFSKEQLNALMTFKAKYAPQIKISLMPIEKLTFFALTEWLNDAKGSRQSIQAFRQINGSGDYLGAAIVMDTTVAGSMGLAEHLAPFILPVGIRATLKQQLLPAEAKLACDFSNGFTVKGRADVRDGLVIYDNDVTINMKAEDVNLGGCTLTPISGDADSAEYAALKVMEKEYESMRLKRTQLSRVEKEAYLQGVLADIHNNRRAEEPRYTQVVKQFTRMGWQTTVVEGLTRAADFHWHTNVQDVSNISRVKFTKMISVRGHRSVTVDLPTNLCLVYNSAINAYDRCTEVEEDSAKNMLQAAKDAENTDACKDTQDPFECGRQRDALGLTRRDAAPLTPSDTILVRDI